MGTRGRKAIEVTSAELQVQINELETAQPDGKFPNRSALWSALESSEWAKARNPRPLTAQVAMILAKNANLTMQTPVGKRGREPGQGPVNVGPRKSKTANPDHAKALYAEVPEQYHSVVKKALNGSLKAVIKLNCLGCVCYQKKEVALCPITRCSNWGVRPYKHKESLTEAGRKRISLGLLDDKEKDDEQTPDSDGTVV